jgi:hypothetical protein
MDTGDGKGLIGYAKVRMPGRGKYYKPVIQGQIVDEVYRTASAAQKRAEYLYDRLDKATLEELIRPA